MNDERKQQYFAELAPRYAMSTGNTTKDIFAKLLDTTELGITDGSVVHDNASGPGTASQVLVASGKSKPTIIATDFSSGMIDTLRQHNLPNVQALVADSAKLDFQDGYFSHSINNFSLFTFTNPIESLRETYRTLQEGGTAVVLLWKRFAVQSILATAQDIVKGEGFAAKHAVPINGPQYLKGGVVAEQLVEAGFQSRNIRTTEIQHLLGEGENREGMFEFMTTSSIGAGSTKGWTTEELARWPQAIRQAMEQEDSQFGGLNFEAWVTVATK